MSSLFSSEQTTQNETEQSQSPDVNTMLSGIKNEKGEPKYQNLEKAIEALQHSQSYIPELKTQLSQRDEELSALRSELAKQKGVQETLERLGQTATASSQPNNQTESQEATQDLETVVAKQLEAITASKQKAENTKKVTEVIKNSYGEKAQEFLSNRANELGISVEQIGTMAETSPAAALTLLGVDDKHSRNFSSVNAGGYRTESITTKKEPLGPPKVSLMRGGAKAADFAEYMKRVREQVYSDLGVQE